MILIGGFPVLALSFTGSYYLGGTFLNHFVGEQVGESALPRPVAVAFKSVFATSCFLLELLVFEVISIANYGIRLWAWKATLNILSLMGSIGLPLFYAFFIARRHGLNTVRSKPTVYSSCHLLLSTRSCTYLSITFTIDLQCSENRLASLSSSCSPLNTSSTIMVLVYPGYLIQNRTESQCFQLDKS